MPTFAYQAIAGACGSGTAMIDAPDRASAVRLLRSRGVTPASLEEVTSRRALRRAGASRDAEDGAQRAEAPAGGRGVLAMPRRAAMGRSEFASFMRELATATQAGLTILQALRTIARQGRTARQREMLEHLIGQVEHGRSVADAAQAWGAPFSPLTVQLLRAGEASGRLEEVLDQAATLLDREVELRRSLLSATLYPMMLIGLIGVAVTIVVTVVVPRILAPLNLSPADLPMPTRVVQGVAWLVGGYWWLILGLLAAGLFAGSRILARPSARLAVDGVLLRIPVLGRLLRDVAVARFTRTLGTLMGSGLPALTALKITRHTLGNSALKAEIETVCDRVSSGSTIAEPLERSGRFPPLLVQIIGVGERSGRLSQMLRQAADAFERRTEASIRLFTTVLPPVLVLMMALVVGFVIAAVLLPILQMQEAIG